MEGTTINFEIWYAGANDNRIEFFKFAQTEEQLWLEPLWHLSFESEEKLKLAAYMWHFYQGKNLVEMNVATFMVIYQCTLRSLGHNIVFSE